MGKSQQLTVVERAIALCGGGLTELAKRVSKFSEKEITRQRAFGWRLRGTFPREVMPAVERALGISLEDQVKAKRRARNPANAVERAIRRCTPKCTPAALAEALSAVSGQKITRQMVNNWQALEQFPVDIVPWVALVTKMPIKELLEGRIKKTKTK